MIPTYRNIITCILLIFLSLQVSRGHAQQRDSSPQKERKNCLSLSISLRDHFDGAPIMQTRHVGQRGWTNLGFGFEYFRRIGSKSGLSFSLNNFWANFYIDNEYPRKPGDVTQRNGALFEVTYHRYLATLRGIEIYGMIGLNYRRGYEFVSIDRYFSVVSTTWYNLREPGITAGLRASRLLFWRLELNAAVKFTQYFFRFDDGSIHGEHYPNRSTRNMLTMQVGLGFRF